MRVLIAPDKFRGSATAVEVAAHLEAGLRSVLPGLEVERVPVADGGEGTVEAAIGAGFDRRQATVTGPTGQAVRAAFATRGATAVIELAEASGLGLLPVGVTDALGATSRGTGDLIAAALDLGCTEIVLGIGGSACTDGGVGLLSALGARFLDDRGTVLPDGGGALHRVAAADLSGLDPRLTAVSFTVASDVDNPLVGPLGAASVFGPQKGASPVDVRALDAGLHRLTEVLTTQLGPGVADSAGMPGAGAAGGVGFAAIAVLGARRRPGAAVVLELVGLRERMRGAALVITGEGSLDRQSLGGKTPVGVAAAARGIAPVFAVCGRTTLSPSELRAAGFDRTFALTELQPIEALSMRDAGILLEQVGARIGALLLRPAGA